MPRACFTASELARRYRVSTTTIYRLIDGGKLEHTRTDGIIQVPEESLEAYFVSLPGPGDRHLAPSEAAGRTGVWTTAIYRLIRAGRLAGLRIGRVNQDPRVSYRRSISAMTEEFRSSLIPGNASLIRAGRSGKN